MPTPGRPITLEPAQQRWRAFFNGHVIADSDAALILREATLAPVIYFPREDVAMEYMGRTSHRTHCSHKGDASYFTLTMDGEILENVAWSYEDPLGDVSRIEAKIAFYADRVEVYAVDDAAVNPRHAEQERARVLAREEAVREERMAREDVDEIIQHTDEGDGASQRDHWPDNVTMPETREGGVR